MIAGAASIARPTGLGRPDAQSRRPDRPRESQFTIGTARFILVVWVTGLALMAASRRRWCTCGALRMTRAEAALVLRDEFFQETRRETDRLQRWRRWFKERVALRRRAGK